MNILNKIFNGEIEYEFPVPCNVYEECGISRDEISDFLRLCDFIRSDCMTTSNAMLFDHILFDHIQSKNNRGYRFVWGKTIKFLCNASGIEFNPNMIEFCVKYSRLRMIKCFSPLDLDCETSTQDGFQFPGGYFALPDVFEFKGRIEECFKTCITTGNKIFNFRAFTPGEEYQNIGLSSEFECSYAKFISNFDIEDRAKIASEERSRLMDRYLDVEDDICDMKSSLSLDNRYKEDIESTDFLLWTKEYLKYKKLTSYNSEYKTLERKIESIEKIIGVIDALPQSSSGVIDTTQIENLYLYYMQPRCVEDHNTVSVTVRLPFSNGYEKRFNAIYCTECNKYFVFYEQIKNVQDQLKCILDFPIKCDEWADKPFNSNGMRKESKLAFYGYHVGQTGLSTGERQDLLSTLINLKLMSKQEIISWISTLIRWKGSQYGMEYARSDWEEDLRFLNHFQMSGQREILARKIIKNN